MHVYRRILSLTVYFYLVAYCNTVIAVPRTVRVSKTKHYTTRARCSD